VTAPAITERAHSALRATGERVTPARLRVYSALLGSARALSHHDLESALGPASPRRFDRVTLYRVLDWLVELGLAQRVAGIDRVWRFSIAREPSRAQFQCNRCGKVVPLGETPARSVPLPRGFRSECVELTVKGRCAECG
jgi:Fur family ferric uptake transcriptional regulator